MGVTIYLSHINAQTKLNRIKGKVDAIQERNAFQIAYPQECSQIMIEQYYLCLAEISRILGSYKTLLTKDILEIQNAIDVMTTADQTAILNFK